MYRLCVRSHFKNKNLSTTLLSDSFWLQARQLLCFNKCFNLISWTNEQYKSANEFLLFSSYFSL